MHPAAPRHVYLNLAAIRGVAAISVMLYHFSPFLADGKVLPSSYLAVDLFFLLSGFVIAHAYDRKIENGMGFGTFVAIRLIRLYPALSGRHAARLLLSAGQEQADAGRIHAAVRDRHATDDGHAVHPAGQRGLS